MSRYTGPWLYVGLSDGPGRNPVRLAFCRDAAAVRATVRGEMFFVSDGGLHPEEEAQAIAAAEELLDEGFLNFEGDPGVRLYPVTIEDIAAVSAQAAGGGRS